MNSLIVFTAKELREQIKTFKGIVVAAVLCILGMMSPLLAKITPEILKNADLGVTIKIPAPTYLDSYTQFFKNIGEMAIIVVLLVFAGSVVTETVRGTAQIILAKRLPRSIFLLSKFLSAALVWTVSYSASAALCYFYTVYLFPKGTPAHLFLSLFCMWLFGMLVLAIALFSSTVFTNYALAAVGGFALWGILLITSAIPKIKDGTPAVLVMQNMGILSGSVTAAYVRVPIIICLSSIVLLILLSCLIFRRREL